MEAVLRNPRMAASRHGAAAFARGPGHVGSGTTSHKPQAEHSFSARWTGNVRVQNREQRSWWQFGEAGPEDHGGPSAAVIACAGLPGPRNSRSRHRLCGPGVGTEDECTASSADPEDVGWPSDGIDWHYDLRIRGRPGRARPLRVLGARRKSLNMDRLGSPEPELAPGRHRGDKPGGGGGRGPSVRHRYWQG